MKFLSLTYEIESIIRKHFKEELSHPDEEKCNSKSTTWFLTDQNAHIVLFWNKPISENKHNLLTTVFKVDPSSIRYDVDRKIFLGKIQFNEEYMAHFLFDVDKFY